MEKYKELYNHSKSVFNEELNRFNRIDSKAAQYLAVLTLLIGLAAYLGQWLIEYIIPPNGIVDWILLVLGICIFISLILSWYFNFKVLKLHGVYKIPLDDETIEFYNSNRLIDIYFAMSKGLKDMLIKNTSKTDNKAKYLTYGYRCIITSAALLVLFSIPFIVKNWDSNKLNNQKEKIMMSKEDNQDQEKPTDSAEQPKPVNEEKPDPTVKPPTFRLVTEGYDPKKLQKGENDKKTVKKIVKPDSTKKEK